MGDVESIMRAGADVDHTQQLPMSQSLWCATHRSSLTASPISTLSTQASSMGLGCHGHPQIYQISIIATESSSMFSQKFALTPSPQQLIATLPQNVPGTPNISHTPRKNIMSPEPDRAGPSREFLGFTLNCRLEPLIWHCAFQHRSSAPRAGFMLRCYSSARIDEDRWGWGSSDPDPHLFRRNSDFGTGLLLHTIPNIPSSLTKTPVESSRFLCDHASCHLLPLENPLVFGTRPSHQQWHSPVRLW